MNSSSSQQKKRYSIFRNDILTETSVETFKKVPYHFDFSHKVKYVFDHSNQSFNTISSPTKNQRSSSKRNKIFDRKRSKSQQKSYMSSIEQTNRCASLCGHKSRNHVIFKSQKGQYLSQQDQPSIRDARQEEQAVKLVKTQTQIQNKRMNFTSINKNQQQKIQFYRQQLEKKLKQRQRQRVSAIREFQRVQTEVKNPPDLYIMRPEQYAKMIKHVRQTAKSKRNQIVYPVPRVLSEVPYNDNACFERSKNNKECLVYRI